LDKRIWSFGMGRIRGMMALGVCSGGVAVDGDGARGGGAGGRRCGRGWRRGVGVIEDAGGWGAVFW